MPTQTVTVVEDIGNGETKVIEQTLPTTKFAVKIDGTVYTPSVVTQVEMENDGETTTTMDQCGNMERERTGDNGWLIRVQGIITANTDRETNLSLPLMRDAVAGSSNLQIRSDMISGAYEVSNTVITQSNDLVSVNTPQTNGNEKAYEFQLQMGEESTSS